MKKLLLILTCSLLYLNAYCQSFTFKEIMHLSAENDIRGYLKSKSFDIYNVDKTHKTYIKNGGTNEEEMIYIGPKGISYNILDANYIKVLLKQIKTHLIIKNDDPKYIFYQFGDTHLVILVNISKTPNTYSSISVSTK